MNARKHFLTLVAGIAILVGTVCVFQPTFLLQEIKHAVANPASVVMARTAGMGFLAVGLLNFAVRNHDDSPSLRAILGANLLFQLALIPIDPWAFAEGTFRTLGSFVPNTILHIVLAIGFTYFLRQARAPEEAATLSA